MDAESYRGELGVLWAEPALRHEEALSLLVVPHFGRWKPFSHQLDVRRRRHHHARDRDVGRQSHLEVHVFVSGPGDLPSKLDRVTARSERASQSSAAVDVIHPLVAHRRLRVERRESGGKLHAHVVGHPRRSTEVVDGQRLLDLDAILPNLARDCRLRHDEGLLDVVRDGVDVEHHVHRLRLL